MKKMMILAALLAFNSAQAACLGEAQIISKVDAVIAKSATACVVSVKDVSFYNESQVCPLDLSQVVTSGIQLGLSEANECSLQSGDTLTGIVVLNSSGQLTLE